MTELVSVWSGAKERSGEAAGLSSPYIGSSARLCMNLGGNHRVDKHEVKPVYVRRRTGKCERCRAVFERTWKERLCAPCFCNTNRPVWL